MYQNLVDVYMKTSKILVTFMTEIMIFAQYLENWFNMIVSLFDKKIKCQIQDYMSKLLVAMTNKVLQ